MVKGSERGTFALSRCDGMRYPVTLRTTGVDRSVLYQVFVERQYADDVLERRPMKLIVDAGAHIGFASVFFANKCPEAKVIAIEPSPSNLELLHSNTAPYPAIQVIHGALWPTEGQLAIANPEAASWAFQVRPDSGANIPAVTIPMLVEAHGRIDLLKIDIEGAEKALFGAPGSPSWLDGIGCVMIELHDGYVPGCSHAFYSWAVGREFQKRQRGEVDILEFSDQHSQC